MLKKKTAYLESSNLLLNVHFAHTCSKLQTYKIYYHYHAYFSSIKYW